jgi:hypothetical protein
MTRTVGVCVAALVSLAAHSASAKTVSPAGAGVMSAVVPGAGQVYAGYTGTGLGFLALASTIVVGAAFSTVESLSDADADDSTQGWLLAPYGVHLWNVADAVHRAKRYNEAQRAEGKALLSPTPSRGFRLELAPTLGPQERGLSVSAQFRF